jgi:AraC-like DNA-binding protein
MRETALYSGCRFALKEFRCPAEDARWHRDNFIGPWPLAVFPMTSVVIRHEGKDALLANANHVVFYRGGDRYQRVLHDPRGDHCLFIGFDAAAVSSLLTSAGVSCEEIPFAVGPSAARPYLRLRVAAQAASAGNGDALAIEEAVSEALSTAVEAGIALNRIRRARRPSTETEQARIVERTKQLLTERAFARDSLSAIACTLHTSEFHLARVFRSRTGYTLHGYRNHLRLRAALERLPRQENLTALARELGFNSHSHFTDAFRAVFGVPPSTARAACGRRELRELSRILEAPAPLAS